MGSKFFMLVLLMTCGFKTLLEGYGIKLILTCLVFPVVFDNSSYAHDREDESNGEYKAPKELYEPVRRGIEMGQTMYAGESRPPDKRIVNVAHSAPRDV